MLQQQQPQLYRLVVYRHHQQLCQPKLANISTSLAALPEKQNKNNDYVMPAMQTGMDRYTQIKRKLSPLNSQRKITQGNASLSAIETPMNTSRFKIFAKASDV